jgi:hypothetical protein
MFSKSIAIGCVLVFAADAAAQTQHLPRRIAPETPARSWDRLQGSRLKISTGPESSDDQAVIGVLLGIQSDTLILRVDGSSEPVSLVPTHSTQVQQWQRDDPTKSYVVAGVLMGSVVGGAVGALVNNAPEPQHCPSDLNSAAAAVLCGLGMGLANAMEESADQLVAVAAGVVIGAAIGALGGRSLGRSRVREGWSTVSPVELRVQPSLHNGVQFSVSLSH